MSLDESNQGPFTEGAIDDDGDPALARDRENALLDLAVENVVADLHEVERLRAQELLDLGVTPSLRCRDADISDLSRRFHREEHREVVLPVDEIVHLHQVEAGYAPFAT